MSVATIVYLIEMVDSLRVVAPTCSLIVIAILAVTRGIVDDEWSNSKLSVLERVMFWTAMSMPFSILMMTIARYILLICIE